MFQIAHFDTLKIINLSNGAKQLQLQFDACLIQRPLGNMYVQKPFIYCLYINKRIKALLFHLMFTLGRVYVGRKHHAHTQSHTI